MIADKLKSGDEVRVIAPSLSLGIISKEQRKIAEGRLNQLGLKITYGQHADELDEFHSSSVQSRLADIHEAFGDPKVKAILTCIGGFNSNQLLRGLDFDFVRNHPKILCGYSDITALSNAMFAKTGLVGYSGPHFSTFSMIHGFDYSLAYFKKCFFHTDSYDVLPSENWSDDMWFVNQQERQFHRNEGWLVVSDGEAEGTVLGGNLCTFNLLQGTEFMPSLDGAILFLEDDEATSAGTFDRDLQSLMHQPGFNQVRGLVIGRFQKASNITRAQIVRMLAAKPELKGIPIIADVDFGHTSPMFTFPIGGHAKLVTSHHSVRLTISVH